ncbi:MAG: hypothetical protein HZC28_19540 [Spirochaetes bacterium]|nr:hypothetical protein [Spirochaetota bacterium]
MNKELLAKYELLKRNMTPHKWELLEHCALYVSLTVGEDLTDPEIMHLLSNLRVMKGGLSKIINYLKSKNKPLVKTYGSDMAKEVYYCTGCPRFSSCTVIVSNLPDMVTSTYTQARVHHRLTREQMEINLALITDRAYEGTGTYVIKAPVGSGKTRLIVDHLMQGQVILFPTHALKNEFYQLAKAKHPELNYYLTEQAPLDAIPELSAKVVKAAFNLSDYSKGCFILSQYRDIPRVENYLKSLDQVKKIGDNTIIISTHCKLAHLRALYPHRKIIIDEDPINEIIKIYKSKTAPFDNIVLDKVTPVNRMSIKPDDRAIHALFKKSDYYYASVNTATDNTDFTFVKKLDIDLNNTIIFSATISANIWKELVPNLNHMEVGHVQTKGKLFQHVMNTSRAQMKNDTDILPSLREKFPDHEVCTFKPYAEDDQIYFGNNRGYDLLRGKDMIVVGTPYPSPISTRLISAIIHGLAEDESICYQTVLHNGNIFKFTTFNDTPLREVHLWQVESELIQAIGRNRLLREDCETHVYTDFILADSIIIT